MTLTQLQKTPDGYRMTYTMHIRFRGTDKDLGWNTFIRRNVGGLDLECSVSEGRGRARGESFIRLESGGAFTATPDWSRVAIWPNGDVELDGPLCATATDKMHKKGAGPPRSEKVRRKLDAATLHSLLARFARLDFATLPDHVGRVPDSGSQTVSLRVGDRWIVKAYDNMLTVGGPHQLQPVAAELQQAILVAVGGNPCAPGPP